MKLKITDLEKQLNTKIKRNFNSIGFDTATKTGVAMIKTNTIYLTIDWTTVQFHADNIQEVYKQMYWNFAELINKNYDVCIIEKAFVKLNPSVALKLAIFGGLVMAHAINNQVHFEQISAKSARAKLGIKIPKGYKGKSKQAVAEWLKCNLNFTIDDNDIADAVVLALLGIIEGMNFEVPKKVRKRK